MEFRHLQHLFCRAGFGLDKETIENSRRKSKEQVVRNLFRNSENPEVLKLNMSEFNELINLNYREFKAEKGKLQVKKLRKRSRQKIKELNAAWIDRLSTSENVLQEKMTLFWVNNFVCRDYTVWHAQHYNNTLRKYALGNFRDFVKTISREASMSKYLNNRQNRKASPNENFARELMELFTLGIGHYTETDIKEAARAFTGWSFKPNGDFFLRHNQHDEGEKTFMGKTGNFDGDDIIDIILEQKQCARYICSKVYKYFVNPEIDGDHLNEITEIFYRDYDIKNLMQHIFEADWFYDEKNIGVKIKSPIELLVGIKRMVPFQFEREKQLIYIQKIMGQTLLDPPNVAGWKGGRNWIDPNSLMIRLKLAAILLNDAEIDVELKGEFEGDFDNYYKTAVRKGGKLRVQKNWDEFLNQYGGLKPKILRDILIISPLNDNTEEFLKTMKFGGIRDYCIQLMSLPEYQLC